MSRYSKAARKSRLSLFERGFSTGGTVSISGSPKEQIGSEKLIVSCSQ
ncbi:hypothetical protein [Saccharibacter floricola]|nr:hypothetical protein [Saccharibacter floricola]